ncbi:unnamed protein product [Phytomonas sp. EM1]|nr:unnamed protein product [Phytomonas sp. EM1]|eukprot:CCW62383.1 unnamed protein product [Phytomonas sp. isolate EM1]
MRRMPFLARSIRQQKLFTGSLFPEEINDKLYSFAQQHGLKSHVWVPRKAFEIILKPFGISILPSPAFCDVSATFWTSYLDVSQTLGDDRVLINADHTSNPVFLEHFDEYIVPPPMSREGRASDLPHGGVVSHCWTGKRFLRGSYPIEEIPANHGSKSHNELNSSEPSHDIALRPACPLTITGAPILNGSIVRRLLQIQSERGYRMNYWVKSVKNFKTKHYKNVEELPNSGQFNPTWCVLYKPHTRTNQSFPSGIRRLMIQRTVEYGYVSRLWITMREAEELYQVGLLPERAHDSPPILCNAFSGGLDLIQFYCADQFEGGNAFFCNYMETNLAVSGIKMPLNKLRGFPLLSQLMREGVQTDGSSVDASKSPSSPSVLRGELSGADTAMLDSERHIRYKKAVEMYYNIRLFKFLSMKDEKKHLSTDDLRGKLRKQCILCGFPTPHFIHSKVLVDYDLSLGAQEVGFRHGYTPIGLWDKYTWLRHLTWFNFAQLAEPLVGLTLFYKHPTNFFTGQYLPGTTATQCARLQVIHGYQSHEWVTHRTLRELGWSVQQGAPGISSMNSSLLCRIGLFDRKVVASIFFNLDEILICQKTKEWVRNYRPIDTKGRLFVDPLQTLLKLRAYERGYRSTVWVVISPFHGYRLKKTITPVHKEVKQALTSSVFLKCPMVRHGRSFLANEEDAESCSPEESIAISDRETGQYDNEDDFLILSNDDYGSGILSQYSESLPMSHPISEDESILGEVDGN